MTGETTTGETAAREASDGRARRRDGAGDERVASLVEENERLRAERADGVRDARFRRAAGVLLGLSVALAVVGGLLSGLRTVAVSLAGIGLFTSVLLYFTSAGRFVPLGTAERVAAPLLESREALVYEFDLVDEEVYVPTSADPPEASVLALPSGADVPPVTALEAPVIDAAAGGSPSEDGLAFRPSGGSLFVDYAPRLSVGGEERPADLAAELAEAVVEEFEIADDVEVEVEADDGIIRVDVEGVDYGLLSRFDHPVISFLGTGLAVTLRRPVRVEERLSLDDRGSERVSFGLE